MKGGWYVKWLEVDRGVAEGENPYSGKWAGKRYSSVPDSLVEVTNGDLKAYYDSHKNMFKQTPSRTISYVVFAVDPTDADLKALEETATEVGGEFAATSEVKSFVRANRNGKVADNYVSKSQLSDEEAEALMADKMSGTVLKSNNWTLSRVVTSNIAPDP
mgnify:CR=1 FL=1